MKQWILAGSLLILAGCSDEAEPKTSKTEACDVKVDVSVVNHAKDKTLFEKAMCFDQEETALDALEETKLDVVKTGKGEMAYVTAVEGVREKSAGASSGWVFGVNEKPGEVGAGSYELQDGDRLEWRFEKDAMAYFQ